MTDPPMYNVASAVLCRSLAIVRSPPLPGCGYERDFMLSLSDNNQTDIVEAFNPTSRYLEDLLNIDNSYFEHKVG